MALNRLPLDVHDEISNSLAILIGGKMCPTWEVSQATLLSLLKIGEWPILAPEFRSVLFRLVQPDPSERLARDELTDGMNARPVLRLRNEVLFAALREDVPESSDLVFFRVFDGLNVKSTLPKRTAPIMDLTDLTGDISIEIRHEGRGLFDSRGAQEQMVMVR